LILFFCIDYFLDWSNAQTADTHESSIILDYLQSWILTYRFMTLQQLVTVIKVKHWWAWSGMSPITPNNSFYAPIKSIFRRNTRYITFIHLISFILYYITNLNIKVFASTTPNINLDNNYSISTNLSWSYKTIFLIFHYLFMRDILILR